MREPGRRPTSRGTRPLSRSLLPSASLFLVSFFFFFHLFLPFFFDSRHGACRHARCKCRRHCRSCPRSRGAAERRSGGRSAHANLTHFRRAEKRAGNVFSLVFFFRLCESTARPPSLGCTDAPSSRESSPLTWPQRFVPPLAVRRPSPSSSPPSVRFITRFSSPLSLTLSLSRFALIHYSALPFPPVHLSFLVASPPRPLSSIAPPLPLPHPHHPSCPLVHPSFSRKQYCGRSSRAYTRCFR